MTLLERLGLLCLRLLGLSVDPSQECHLCDTQGTYYTQSGKKECKCPT